VPAGYLEAVACFHQLDFAGAIAHAHAAFAQSPTFYEAGDLEARAHLYRALDLRSEGNEEGAKKDFAESQRTFERVREVARSDETVCAHQGEALFNELWSQRTSSIDEALATKLLAAYHDARTIAPDDLELLMKEARFYNFEAGIAASSGKDPSAAIGKALALVNSVIEREPQNPVAFNMLCQALTRKAGHDELEASARAAADACATSVRLTPSMERYNDLGNAWIDVAHVELARGADPTSSFARAAGAYRDALAIGGGATMHHNLADLYREQAEGDLEHGRDPRAAIDRSLVEVEAALRLNKRLSYSESVRCATLVLRGRDELGRGADPRPTAKEALAACDRCLEMNPQNMPAMIQSIEAFNLDARYRVEHSLDAGDALTRARSAAARALAADATDESTHLAAARTEWIAARAGGRREALLARAAAEAQRAIELNPRRASALALAAEVELARAEAGTRAAAARGLALVGRALAIDPGLVSARATRDALAPLATAH
jgi:tetratricopeptide (TPR) repeat protein